MISDVDERRQPATKNATLRWRGLLKSMRGQTSSRRLPGASPAIPPDADRDQEQPEDEDARQDEEEHDAPCTGFVCSPNRSSRKKIEEEQRADRGAEQTPASEIGLRGSGSFIVFESVV